MNQSTNVTKYDAEIGDLLLSLFITKKENEKINKTEQTTLMHTHFYTEIFVCVNGVIKLASENGEAELFPGDIAIMPKNHTHSALSGENCEFFTIGMLGAPLQKRKGSVYKEFSRILESGAAQIYRNANSAASQLLSVTKMRVKKDSPFPVVRAVAALSEVITGEECELFNVGSGKSNECVSRDVNIFLKVEEIINSHYTEPLKYDKLTNSLHISRRHLDRLVSAKYGKTLRELVYDSRINLAKTILKNTKLSLDAIAVRVGFESTPSFRNYFVRVMGKTPTEYRKTESR